MLCTKVGAIVVWLTICTVTSKNVNKLEGQHLDVITVHVNIQRQIHFHQIDRGLLQIPPMMIITGSMNGSQYSGPIFYHLDWLSKRLHFRCINVQLHKRTVSNVDICVCSYTLRQEGNNIIGAKVNGSWNGMMGQMQNQVLPAVTFIPDIPL
jgi:hypothetical protein